MVDPRLGRHATHDPRLVAAYAAGDAAGSSLDRAAQLVAVCASCAGLHRDLRLISAALSSAPAPGRPRDFRLSADEAASLDGGSRWRRLGARASTMTRLVASVAALGVAVLLFGGAVRLNPMGAGSSTAALDSRATESSFDLAQPLGVPSAAASTAPSHAAGTPWTTQLIDRERAIAIARTCLGDRAAAARVEAADMRTFADIAWIARTPTTPTLAPVDPVWLVRLDVPSESLQAGATCAIDARTGDVLGSVVGSGNGESLAPVSS